MSEIALLPDLDNALLDLCIQFEIDGLDAANVSNLAPTPGTDPLPAAQLYVYDGDADALGGRAIFDVHFFAADYATASRLARTFDARIMLYPHRIGGSVSAVLLDRIETISIPTEVPWVEDNSTRRFQATYSATFRRR